MLLNYYDGSPYRFLRAMLPDAPWRPWLFAAVPEGHWSERQNRQQCMEYLAAELGVEKPEDWYGVTANQFRDKHCGGLLKHYRNSPVLAITDHLPDFPWEPEKFAKRKKTQQRLYSLVCRLFRPEKDGLRLTIYDVSFDHKHEDLRFLESNRKMEIDVYVPDIRLAFEYQGEQHFFAIPCWGGEEALKEVQARDREKAARCRRANITLIQIPYTWRGDKQEFMKYLTEAWDQREEAMRREGRRMPRVLIRPTRTRPAVSSEQPPQVTDHNAPDARDQLGKECME
jgi:hypothetical protein